MKYKSVIVTRTGGPEVLQVIENDLRAPFAGEVRIKILAAAVCHRQDFVEVIRQAEPDAQGTTFKNFFKQE